MCNVNNFIRVTPFSRPFFYTHVEHIDSIDLSPPSKGDM